MSGRDIRELWFLIGYRGTGKTAVAQILARHLDWQWVDADGVLERRYGQGIREIFAGEGEAAFRDKEALVLEELCTLQRHVIATGGGVILRADNREQLRMAGRVFWLTGLPQTLWDRIQGDSATAERRPPLSSGGLKEIEELLAAREPLYRACADFTVDTTKRTPEEVAALILTAERERTRA